MARFIKVDDAVYAFDIKKICDFLAEATGKEMKETEILDTFDYATDEDKKLNAKSVRELKTFGNGQESLIYDLIKIFVVQVIVYDAPGDIDLNDMPFGTKLAFNTLLSSGFLCEVKNDKNKK